jgi:hypothetical protein
VGLTLFFSNKKGRTKDEGDTYTIKTVWWCETQKNFLRVSTFFLRNSFHVLFKGA